MSPTQRGAISQRALVKTLLPLIDTARSDHPSPQRDIARSTLRALLADPDTNWRTSFVYHNLNPRRCRYLTSIGFWVPSQWLWREYRGVEERADVSE